MKIIVLGPGCPRCHEVERRTINALAELGVAADVEKVSDVKKIMEFDIIGTPGLALIDGKIVCSEPDPPARSDQGLDPGGRGLIWTVLAFRRAERRLKGD